MVGAFSSHGRKEHMYIEVVYLIPAHLRLPVPSTSSASSCLTPSSRRGTGAVRLLRSGGRAVLKGASVGEGSCGGEEGGPKGLGEGDAARRAGSVATRRGAVGVVGVSEFSLMVGGRRVERERVIGPSCPGAVTALLKSLWVMAVVERSLVMSDSTSRESVEPCVGGRRGSG